MGSSTIRAVALWGLVALVSALAGFGIAATLSDASAALVELAARIDEVEAEALLRDADLVDEHRVRCSWEIEWGSGSWDLRRAAMLCGETDGCTLDWSVPRGAVDAGL